MRLWRDGQPAGVLHGHDDAVNCLVAVTLPDGSAGFASGSDDKTVVVWDISRQGFPIHRRLRGHRGSVESLAALCADRDGGTAVPTLLASGSIDRSVRVWRLDGSQSQPLVALFTEHTARVAALGVLPDGSCASGSWDGTIRVWNPRLDRQQGKAASGIAECTQRAALVATAEWHHLQPLAERNLGVTCLAVLPPWSPDGVLAAGYRDSRIRIWREKTAAIWTCTRVLEGHKRPVWSLEVLPVWSGVQHPMLASGSLDGSIKLWESGRCTATLDVGMGSAAMVWALCSACANCLVVVPPGVLATGHDDYSRSGGGGVVHLWF